MYFTAQTPGKRDEYQNFVILFFLTVSFSDKPPDYYTILMLYCRPVIGNFKIIG
jgi:hypothetical protein